MSDPRHSSAPASEDCVWTLTVSAVADRYGGLMARLGFRPSKYGRSQWWIVFDPRRTGERTRAAEALKAIREIGATWRWRSKARQAAPVRRALAAKAARLGRDGARYLAEEESQTRRLVDRDIQARAARAVARANGDREV